MLLGFTGLAGSGKSTACQMVQDALEDTKRINFKDALIAEIRSNFPLFLVLLAEKYDESVDWLFENKPPEFRAFMQNYGTELRRGPNPEYWTDQWKGAVLMNQQYHIVTDDVRFLNEATAVKKVGGIIVRIIRTDITNTGSHQSETEMSQIEPDYTISVGMGEHEELKLQIDSILQKELYKNQ